MNTHKFVMAVLGFGMIAQSGLIANAVVVKNPVDLTPTAIQQSGATYDSNVVTKSPKSVDSTTTTTTTETSRMNSRMDGTRHTTVEKIDGTAVTETDVLIPTQQAQMERTSNHWFGAVVGMIVVAGLLLFALKRERQNKSLNLG